MDPAFVMKVFDYVCHLMQDLLSFILTQIILFVRRAKHVQQAKQSVLEVRIDQDTLLFNAINMRPKMTGVWYHPLKA